MYTIGIYPEDIDPEHFFFWLHGSPKVHCIYQRFLKEGNIDNKYLRCPSLWYNNFNILQTDVVLDKTEPVLVER